MHVFPLQYLTLHHLYFRFIAIHRPMFYETHIRGTKLYSSLTILGVWILGFLIAIIPLFTPELYYSITETGIIIATKVNIVKQFFKNDL